MDADKRRKSQRREDFLTGFTGWTGFKRRVGSIATKLVLAKAGKAQKAQKTSHRGHESGEKVFATRKTELLFVASIGFVRASGRRQVFRAIRSQFRLKHYSLNQPTFSE